MRRVQSARSRGTPRPSIDRPTSAHAQGAARELESSVDDFARALCMGSPSPLKASARAARSVANAAKRVPLHALLDQLERTVSQHLMTSPAKVAPRARATGALQPSPRPEQHSGHPPLVGRGSGGDHMLKHVVELYDSFVVREEVVKAKAIHDSSSSSAVTAPAPSAGSFLDLLHLYYPSFSRTTLESMVRDAREGIDAVDRRRFLIMAKGHYAARLKMAFLNCDKDKSGGLSVDEFIAAVQSTGAKPPTTSKINSTPTPKAPLSPNAAARTLRVLFAQADENRDGILQFDEVRVCVCGGGDTAAM